VTAETKPESNAVREALVLPALFLTSFLAGGFRGGGSVRLVPPALSALVLAALLVAALLRSGVWVPAQFVSARRTGLANASGVAACAAMLLASAQALNVVMPEDGLLHAAFALLLAVQLLTTLAALRDRAALLRSLAVLLGCAFVLRFIVLESLFAPQPGWLKRVLAAALEGVSLGTLSYAPTGTITGYTAFAALSLYLWGVFLMAPPGGSERGAERLTIPEA
jgi:uncharacterized membrane protein